MPFNHQELCFIVGKLRFLYLHKKVIYHFIFLLNSSSIRQKEILKEKKNYVSATAQNRSRFFVFGAISCPSRIADHNAAV